MRISIIGAGNVGGALATATVRAGWKLVGPTGQGA